MGVNVDEAGCDDVAPRIDLLGPASGYVANVDDPAIPHADVCHERLAARPIHHRAATNDQIISHAHSQILSGSLLCSGYYTGLLRLARDESTKGEGMELAGNPNLVD